MYEARMALTLILSVTFCLFKVAIATWNITCPQRCDCSEEISEHLNGFIQVKMVSCTNMKLDSFPLDLPMDTESLLLSSNTLTSIHQHIPSYMKLKEIDLSNNTIDSLGTYPIFENLTSLHYLNLAGNDIQILFHGSFSGLLNLDYLILSNNSIHYIEDHSFGGLNHLKTLSLVGNKLDSLNSSWFQAMSNLDSLYLDNNQLTEIDNSVFQYLKKLSTLSLRNNYISTITKSAFLGLADLQYLTLDGNLLKNVPSKSMMIFQGLKFLSLSANPILKIEELDFNKLSVSEIILVNMEDLISVDYHAFFNLPELAILHLHDNPKLSYIDPDAFFNMPKLLKLYLHNNNLMALPQNIINQAQQLQEITFYHNPILCDCNVLWIKNILLNETRSYNTSIPTSPSLFPESNKFVCETPLQFNTNLLHEVLLSQIPPMCGPTVVPFFNESQQKELGDSVTFDCRAVGIAQTRVYWILSNGKVVNNTSNFSRIHMGKTGTLRLDYLKASDAGTFTCVASNAAGNHSTSTLLRVHSTDAHVFEHEIGTDFVTLTWNGTGSTISSSNYVIMYRKLGSREVYGIVHLLPYMHAYTVTSLLPHMAYEFCIAYQHTHDITKLNCIDLKTRHMPRVPHGFQTLGTMSVIIALGVLFASVFIPCVGVLLVKRYCRRKLYEEPEGINVTSPVRATYASTIKLEDTSMSQIPLDNLYNPPSTSLYTSRTSLIETSTA